MTADERERIRTIDEAFTRLQQRAEMVRIDGKLRHVIDASEVTRVLLLMLPRQEAERMAAE